MVEIQDFVIVRELIGTNTAIKSDFMRTNPGSIMFHTHLNNHPPSARDFITGLNCTIMYQVLHHGVIGTKKIFKFWYKRHLIIEYVSRIPINRERNTMNLAVKKLETMLLFHDIDSESTDCNDNIFTGYKWIDYFMDRLRMINIEYLKSDNDAVYIKQLADVGIEMQIETRKS